ncbi:MAG: Crp/Fnr family transcriptional regulator, partial [Cystobacter sp.]
PPAGVHGVVDGAIRLRTLGPSGRESLLKFLEPPSWCGEISLFDGQPLAYDAIADVPSVVVQVPPGPLTALLKDQPGYWFEFGRLMAQHMRLTLLSIDETALESAPIRLARRLLLIAQNYGDLHGHSSRVIDLKQEELASMLCISRQTTNQLLKQLEAQGIVGLRYGEIEILDLEKLREVVQGRG